MSDFPDETDTSRSWYYDVVHARINTKTGVGTHTLCGFFVETENDRPTQRTSTCLECVARMVHFKKLSLVGVVLNPSWETSGAGVRRWSELFSRWSELFK